MWAAYDLKYLEDPEGVFGDAETINTIVNAEWAESAPDDVMTFLDNFNWTGEQMGAVMLAITQEGAEPFEAARAWIADNQDVVESWLP